MEIVLQNFSNLQSSFTTLYTLCHDSSQVANCNFLSSLHATLWEQKRQKQVLLHIIKCQNLSIEFSNQNRKWGVCKTVMNLVHKNNNVVSENHSKIIHFLIKSTKIVSLAQCAVWIPFHVKFTEERPIHYRIWLKASWSQIFIPINRR